MDTVGASQVSQDAFGGGCWLWMPDSFDTSRVIFPGGELEGNVCFEVSTSDVDSLVLFGNWFDFDAGFDYRDTLWFWKLR